MYSIHKSDVEMTANFDSQNSEKHPLAGDRSQPTAAPDLWQRDRFELLSAYLDGEVSADERRQVEDWLANDPTVQQLHARLLKLRQAFQAMPIPMADERAVQATVDAVFAKVDRRSHPARWLWGGVAIAAVALGAVTSTFLGENRLSPSLVGQNSDPTNVQPSPTDNTEPLMIALDKPLVSISDQPQGTPAKPNPVPNPNADVR